MRAGRVNHGRRGKREGKRGLEGGSGQQNLGLSGNVGKNSSCRLKIFVQNAKFKARN